MRSLHQNVNHSTISFNEKILQGLICIYITSGNLSSMFSDRVGLRSGAGS